MKVKVVTKTVLTDDMKAELPVELHNAEGLMAYIARVSSDDQDNPDYERLLRYCIKHRHWSVFEQCNMTVEIETSLAIAMQILRHRSFCYQQKSQRYQSINEEGIELYVARRQDVKNRQNSVDDLSDEIKAEWEKRQLENWKRSFEDYKWALDNGIAKECARMVLPFQTKTRLYMTGNVRNWLHYIDLRRANGSQKEHMEIADAIKTEFEKELPMVMKAFFGDE